MTLQGVGVTLSLLNGPTKAAVASAITAAGFGFSALSPSTAHCFTYRPAYDDDVFKSFNSEDPNAPVFTSPYDTINSTNSTYSKKLRPIGTEALSILTSNRNLALTLGRNVALSSLITANKYLQQLYDAEEIAASTGEEPERVPFPWFELQHSVKIGGFNACLDWATQLFRSLFDWASDVYLGLDLSRRLRKDLGASAIRKGQYPFYSRVPRVLRTSFFSNATLYLADWVVACCMEVYSAIKKPLKDRSIYQRINFLGFRCVLQAGRCTAVWMAVAFGNSIGSAAPGRIRGLSMFVCMQIAAVGMNIYCNAFISRVTAGLPAVGPPPVVPEQQQQEVNGEPVVAAAVDAVGDAFGAIGNERRAGPVVGVPRLPARPARRQVAQQQAPVAPPPQLVVPGPETPQAAREQHPQQAAAGEENENFEAVAAEFAQAAVANALAQMEAEEEGAAPMQPETPPTAGENPRQE